MAQPTAGALSIGAKTHSSVRDGNAGEDTHAVEKLAARSNVGALANDAVFNDRVGANMCAGGNNGVMNDGTWLNAHAIEDDGALEARSGACLLYTSPSPRD